MTLIFFYFPRKLFTFAQLNFEPNIIISRIIARESDITVSEGEYNHFLCNITFFGVGGCNYFLCDSAIFLGIVIKLSHL